MFTIQPLNKISQSGLGVLPEANYKIDAEAASPDGIILRSFNMHDMELPASLLAVGRAGAGVNNIPLDKCAEKGIVVFNTPGANANAVKELVLAGLLLSCRKIYDGIAWAQSLKGQEGVAKLVEKGKGAYVGPEIMGKKMGVVGLGAIGALVANSCVALGMEVLGYDPYLPVDAALKIDPSVKKVEDLETIYENCDFITMHLPLLDSTKYMINTETIGKMKDQVRIMNFSRGELVNNADMVKAVQDGKVGAYVIDFPTEEILGVPGIITTPHLGASTPESEDNCACMAATQLKDYLECGNIVNSVNFPACKLPCSGNGRLCVLYKNNDGVLDKINECLSKQGASVVNMASNARGNYGYAIFALSSSADSAAASVESVDGVIRTRAIANC